ncbi:hypothetical protein A3765_16215, partial [Oleiphilus sp. HI0130]
MKISINKEQLGEVELMLKGLSLDGPKILTRALNKTATKGRTRSSEEIRKQVNLKAAYVKGKLNISRATYKNLQSKITAEKRGVLMTRYPHTMLARGGVTVKIKRNGARAKLPSAFKTFVYAGGKRVEVLATPATGKYRTGNRKMKVLYSPSVSQVFNAVRDDIDAEMVDYLAAQTEIQVDTALR